jgi:hypothetical protein
MDSPAAKSETHAAIARCRACRTACDRQLVLLASAGGGRPRFHDLVVCVALLDLVADRLEFGSDCPPRLLELAIEAAGALPEDDVGCARACQEAAELLGDLLAAGYES